MKRFRGKTEDNHPVCKWNGVGGVYEECVKHKQFIVEVREYSEKAEISDGQRKWLHCEEGPIRELVRLGWSFKDAKNHLKIAHGRQWFVKDVTEQNFQKVKGELFWECQIAVCRKLAHPAIMEFIDRTTGPVRVCPFCYSDDIKLIAIQSIMDKSIGITNKWFDEIFAAYPKILPPDPNWKKKKGK